MTLFLQLEKPGQKPSSPFLQNNHGYTHPTCYLSKKLLDFIYIEKKRRRKRLHQP
jgi:hypothetical protein